MKASGRRLRPLYWCVADDIRAKIDAGVWVAGAKLPSERALCERYEVSQITVRRALRELAHMDLVYSQHGLGWFVSQEAASAGSLRDVTLVSPELDWLVAPLAQRLVDDLGPAGVLLRMAFTNGEPKIEPRVIAKARARGTDALLLVVSGAEHGLAEHYTRLVEMAELPVLLLLREVSNVEAPCAVLDERGCLQELTRHILSLGHRRVAYAGDDPSLVEGWQAYRGFSTTLWESGLELPLDWVFSSELTGSEAERFRQAFGGGEGAESRPYRPTALVCSSDIRAAEAMRLLQDMGLHCPADVAIVGLGDSSFAPLLSTPLTTFHFDFDNLSRGVADMMLDVLAGRAVKDVTFSGKLVVRKSCGAGL